MIALILYVAAAIVSLLWLLGTEVGPNPLALVLLLTTAGLAVSAAAVGPPWPRSG